MLYAIVGILVIILDQGVKYWVTTHIMVDVVTEPLIPGVISLVRLHNDGAAFSFLAGGGARIYFIILTAVFTIAVIFALVTNFINGRFGRWCLVLVTAGGLSNCLDRVLYGYVVDMFKIDLFDFAVFNVADIFITVFCILFIIYIIFGGEDKKTDDIDEFDEDDDEDDDRPARGGFKRGLDQARQERAAEKPVKTRAKAGKYDEDADEVASPRFAIGRRAKADADERPARSVESAASKPRAIKQPLEGFGKSAAASTQSARVPKAKKTLYEEDYEQYKAAHPELKRDSARKSAAPAKAAPKAEASVDPFAEWERANARVESRQTTSSTAKAMGIEASTPKVSAPAVDAPAKAASTPAPAARPAAPVAKPAAPAKAAPVSSDDFSLDDILNEFK